MTYVKAIVVGLVTGLIVAVLYVVGALALAFVGLRDAQTGSAGIGAVSVGVSPLSVFVAGMLGFVVGARRTLRLARRGAAGSSQ
jgi:hypothetical protein